MDIEERAEQLLQKLDVTGTRRLEMPRPFFIEFTGSPDSGKTTTIDILDQFFRRQRFRVLRPQEGAEVIRHISRKTPLYNIRTGLYALETLIDRSVSSNYDLVLLDRSLLDAFCWMEYWRRKGQLGEQECRHYQAFFTNNRWRTMLDATFFVVCSTKEALRRDAEIEVTDRFGEYTNPETIALLVDIFNDGCATWEAHGHPVARIDTTKLSRKNMGKTALERAIEFLEKRFPDPQ